MLVDAALLWHQETDQWDAGDLQHLKRERAIFGQAAFSQLIAVNVPQDLQLTLYSGIDSAEDP